MIKEEIIEKISQFFKLSQFEAEKIFDDIFSKIMSGVRDDNIVDIVNFGEFIVKYDNGKAGIDPVSQHKKTVEFLPSPMLEEEIGYKSYDLLRTQFQVPDIEAKEIADEKEKPAVQEEKPFTVSSETMKTEFDKPITILEKPVETSEKTSAPIEPPVIGKEEPTTLSESGISVPQSESRESLSIEDEFKKKREALLNKISIHPLQDSHAVKKPEISEFHYNIPESVPPEIKEEKTELLENKIEDVQQKEKLEAKPEDQKPDEFVKASKEGVMNEDIPQPPLIAPLPVDEINIPAIEGDISNKSFADYFSEIGKEEKPIKKEDEKEIDQSPQVIPRKAVELHEEITQTKTTLPPVSAPLQDVEQPVEKKPDDKSYYIWYKDSEPNIQDTQNMSYEYELLYQATKEAEYKSKLKIYVTTFILFFSIVLVLLIFSPVIYKMFFTPVEQQVTQNAEEQNTGNGTSENKATLNVPPVTQNENSKTSDTSVKPQSEETQKQAQNTLQPEQNSSSEQKKEPTPQTQQNTEPNIEGLVKSGDGWLDKKFNVYYAKLENGKFTIQESSWDSESKASKRISTVEALNIPGLKGNVLKSDLGDKGVWYRARFGEFNTLEEARSKAQELRNK